MPLTWSACLPEGFGIDLGTVIHMAVSSSRYPFRRPYRGRRENLRMQAYSVGIGVPGHAVPRQAYRRVICRNAHEVPRIALQLDRPSLVNRAPRSELPPARRVECRRFAACMGQFMPYSAGWWATHSPAIRPNALQRHFVFARCERYVLHGIIKRGRASSVPCRDGNDSAEVSASLCRQRRTSALSATRCGLLVVLRIARREPVAGHVRVDVGVGCRPRIAQQEETSCHARNVVAPERPRCRVFVFFGFVEQRCGRPTP